MGKCIICGKECAGECCSGACRAKKSRRTQNKAHAHDTERTSEAYGVTIIDEPPSVIPKTAIKKAHKRLVDMGYVCPIPEDQRKPGINYGPYMTAN